MGRDAGRGRLEVRARGGDDESFARQRRGLRFRRLRADAQRESARLLFQFLLPAVQLIGAGEQPLARRRGRLADALGLGCIPARLQLEHVVLELGHLPVLFFKRLLQRAETVDAPPDQRHRAGKHAQQRQPDARVPEHTGRNVFPETFHRMTPTMVNSFSFPKRTPMGNLLSPAFGAPPAGVSSVTFTWNGPLTSVVASVLTASVSGALVADATPGCNVPEISTHHRSSARFRLTCVSSRFDGT